MAISECPLLGSSLAPLTRGLCISFNNTVPLPTAFPVFHCEIKPMGKPLSSLSFFSTGNVNPDMIK